MSRSARFVLFIVAFAAAAHARVISYAPYTDRSAIPAVQNRLDRHFVLVEQLPQNPSAIPVAPPNPFAVPAQLVLYDSKGLEEPRVIYPLDGSSIGISIAAAREEGNAVSVLIQTFDAHGFVLWLMTNDSGATWKNVLLPGNVVTTTVGPDNGGPFVRSKYSQVRIGTKDFPFVANTGAGVFRIAANGEVKQLATGSLAGSDRDGRRFLLTGLNGIQSVDLDGNVTTLSTAQLTGQLEGWITPAGSAFLEHVQNPGQIVLWQTGNGSLTPVAASWDGPVNVLPPINPDWLLFAVPTTDYSGAWILKRGGGRPTELMQFQSGQQGITTPVRPDLLTMWSDVSAPQVEALIPSQSGTKLLIQVHRPRQSVDNLLFKDPALVVWKIGDPAPTKYDELFLAEMSTKGFVHVDVDAIEGGDPFVFDSGAQSSFFGCTVCSPPPPATPGGGSDVVQEWGVVRGSLRQQLVLPGVGHVAGAFGSVWATDLTLYNPSDSPAGMSIGFAPNGRGIVESFRLTTPLQPHEIRLIPDVVRSLLEFDNVTGALYITPDAGSGINVTARTYNTTSAGTYGFTMNGIDIFTAVGSRFPLTFAGAFQGDGFRTNVVVADTSGRGTSLNAAVSGPDGARITQAVAFDAPPSAESQFNFIGSQLSVAPGETGALTLQPGFGTALASVFVIDNRTNDPTYFPPDIPASVMRVIPAIGHLDGANGARFRSDLFLFNNSSEAKTLTLTAQPWNNSTSNEFGIPLTLLPHEARVIRDVLLTLFNKVGIARLRFSTVGFATADTSVRVTSRTYSVDANGGTYGFEMPPLNSFQSGSPGDTLEILGASLDPRFRTNLGLVELSASIGKTPGHARIDIVDNTGQTIDSFERDVPAAGGLQIDDLFHARNLPDSGKPVLIRVTVVQGMIGAYGAFVDNGTNDPSYVAANLAAKN